MAATITSLKLSMTSRIGLSLYNKSTTKRLPIATIFRISTPHFRYFHICSCMSISNKEDATNTVTKNTTVDQPVIDYMEKTMRGKSNHINFRNHPGIMRQKNTQLPVRLVKAVQKVCEKYPVKSLLPKVNTLVQHLSQRRPPVSEKDLLKKTQELEKKILAKEGHNLQTKMTIIEQEAAKDEIRQKVIKQLRKTTYHWKSAQFDAFTTYLYLMGRLSFDYSVILQTFTEISMRDPNFKPTTIFHHGSKVGSGIWAADKVWRTIGEHYCVEPSSHMNTLAQLLLQDANEQKSVSCINGVHFRQFMPSPKDNKFSMVVSSFMLLDQTSEAERLRLVQDLWEMSETYLVLIENGTTSGFLLVNQAKEFILKNAQNKSTYVEPGHVFAPCPHDKSCPKLRTKNLPCLTESVLRDLDFSTSDLAEKAKSYARYSYVILKKGPRETESEWPRVLHPIQATRHVHLHMCLPCGELQHTVFSKNKNGKYLYGCAKHVGLGDRLPVSLSAQPLPQGAKELLVPEVSQSESEDSNELEDNQEYKDDDEHENIEHKDCNHCTTPVAEANIVK